MDVGGRATQEQLPSPATRQSHRYNGIDQGMI